MALLRYGNDSGVPFQGYLRATVDSALPFPNGTSENPAGYFVLGNQCGLDTTCIDLYTVVNPNGDRRQINTNTATAFTWELGSFDPFTNMVVTVGGVVMTLIELRSNGAAWDLRWRARVPGGISGPTNPLLLVEVFMHAYPDDRQFQYVEVLVVNSNPTRPEVVEYIPTGFNLTFSLLGDFATVILAGRPDNGVLMDQGENGGHLADAQTRGFTGVIWWPQFGGSNAMCRALAEGKVTFMGIDKMHHGGNVFLPSNFNTQLWTELYLQEEIDYLNNWRQDNILNPNAHAGSSGTQGSERMQASPPHKDVGTSSAFYFAAVAMKQPHCHCEADGSQLSVFPSPQVAHPQLRLFEGRVHRAPGFSPDTLGKPNDPSLFETHGFNGPGFQHPFDWNQWAGKRLSGTALTEWFVSMRARITMYSVPIAWGPQSIILPSARGTGWWLFNGVEMYRNLTDRALAAQLRQHYLDVINMWVIPIYGSSTTFPHDWWGWSATGFCSAAPLPQCQTWQACVLCLGLRWAGEVFGHQGCLDLSAYMAQEIINRVWFHNGTRWTSRNYLNYDGIEITAQCGTGYWDFFFAGKAVAAMLLANPSHVTANAIWAQLIAEGSSWPPSNVRAMWDDLGSLGSPGVLATAAPTIVGTASVSVETAVAGTNALAISGVVISPGDDDTFSASLVATGQLLIAGAATAIPAIDASVVATGVAQIITLGTVSVSVETAMSDNGATAVLPIVGTASVSTSTSVVAAGANLLGMSGAVNVSVSAAMSDSGATAALAIAGVAAPSSTSTSLVATGAGVLAPSTINGVVSATIEVGVSSTATIKPREPGSPRRRRPWWHWWSSPSPLAGNRRRRSH